MNDHILNSEEKEQLKKEVLESIHSIKDTIDNASDKIHGDVNKLFRISQFIWAIDETFQIQQTPSVPLASVVQKIDELDASLEHWITYSENIIKAVKKNESKITKELKYILAIK